MPKPREPPDKPDVTEPSTVSAIRKSVRWKDAGTENPYSALDDDSSVSSEEGSDPLAMLGDLLGGSYPVLQVKVLGENSPVVDVPWSGGKHSDTKGVESLVSVVDDQLVGTPKDLLDFLVSSDFSDADAPVYAVTTQIVDGMIVSAEVAQIDGGAAITCSNNKALLHHYRRFTENFKPKRPIRLRDAGGELHEPLGIGFLRVPTLRDKGFIDVVCLYVPGIKATIVSPSYVAKQLRMGFVSEGKELDHGVCEFAFSKTKGAKFEYRLEGNMFGDLSYTYPLLLPKGHTARSSKAVSDCHVEKCHSIQLSATELAGLIASDETDGIRQVAALDNATQWHIAHQRLGHMGARRLADAAGCGKGIPICLNTIPDSVLEQCPICLKEKHGKSPKKKATDRPEPTEPGMAVHSDFAFMGMETDDPDRNIEILSIDGESAFLLTVDRYQRQWSVKIMKSKEPPLLELQSWIEKNAPDRATLRKGGAYWRMDQGGELGGSPEVRKLLEKAGYEVEVTGADASFLNGLAERPNREAKNALRCMLHGAGLGAEFWAYCLRYYVRIRNAVEATKYPDAKGEDLTAFRTFGCRVSVRELGDRKYALDTHRKDGIFLGFLENTTDIIHWYDPETKRVKKGYHALYDEGMLDATVVPPNVTVLRNLRRDGNPKTKDDSFPAPIPFTIKSSPFDKLEEKEFVVDCQHETFGFSVDQCPIMLRAYVSAVEPHSTAAGGTKSKRKSRHIGKYIVAVNGSETFSVDEVLSHFSEARKSGQPKVKLRFGIMPTFTARDRGFSENLHLDPDQVNSVQAILTDLRKDRHCQVNLDGTLGAGDEDPTSTTDPPPTLCDATLRDADGDQIRLRTPNIFSTMTVDAMVVNDMIARNQVPEQFDPGGALAVNALTSAHLTDEEKGLRRFTRATLKKLSNWHEWNTSIWRQLDKFYDSKMIGDMVDLPWEKEKLRQALILRPVWQFLVKPTGERKARLCGNGSKGAVPWLHEEVDTFSSSANKSMERLHLAVGASRNHYFGYGDVEDAYASAHGPTIPTYLRIDESIASWLAHRFGISAEEMRGKCIPCFKALQGHPEGGKLFEVWINEKATKLGWTQTTHEPSLYYRYVEGELMLMTRQVDDLLISCAKKELITRAFSELKNEGVRLHEDPLAFQGLSPNFTFNGLEIEQTARFLKISCPGYIQRVLETHGWAQPALHERKPGAKPFSPMSSADYQNLTKQPDGPRDGTPEHAEIEKEKKFNYRKLLGELIYAYTCCRPDIGYPISHLARFASCPTAGHYDALKKLALYLRSTKTAGIHYWHSKSLPEFPDVPVEFFSPEDEFVGDFPSHAVTQLIGLVDAAYGTCHKTRKSTTGVSFQLAGGTIHYKSKLQATTAVSSTEAELIAMAHAGKCAKWFRSVMAEIGVLEDGPTVIYEDNMAVKFIVNNNRPTERARHIDIMYFAVQEWKRRNLIIVEHISTKLNVSDGLSKALDWMLHGRHSQRMMGYFHPLKSDIFS